MKGSIEGRAGLAHNNRGGTGGTLSEGLWTPARSQALVLLSVKLLELSDPPCQAGDKARMVPGGQRDGWSGYLTCGFSFSDKVLRFRDARWIV